MKLSQLISGIETSKILNFKDCEILDIENDSRRIYKNSLFFAVKGNNLDGNDYVLDAVKRGAVAIISENALYYETELSDYFRQFLKEHNGCVEVVPSRSFEESGTTIEVVIIKLIKE